MNEWMSASIQDSIRTHSNPFEESNNSVREYLIESLLSPEETSDSDGESFSSTGL